MGKDSVNISAPNLVNICVDSMDSGVYHGRLYHKYQQEPLRFNDVGALFQTMEKLFDECGYPQNTTQSRTFYRKKEKSVITEMVLHSAGLDGHGCVFQRPHCGAKRPHVITDFPLLLS